MCTLPQWFRSRHYNNLLSFEILWYQQWQTLHFALTLGLLSFHEYPSCFWIYISSQFITRQSIFFQSVFPIFKGADVINQVISCVQLFCFLRSLPSLKKLHSFGHAQGCHFRLLTSVAASRCRKRLACQGCRVVATPLVPPLLLPCPRCSTIITLWNRLLWNYYNYVHVF